MVPQILPSILPWKLLILAGFRRESFRTARFFGFIRPNRLQSQNDIVLSPRTQTFFVHFKIYVLLLGFCSVYVLLLGCDHDFCFVVLLPLLPTQNKLSKFSQQLYCTAPFFGTQLMFNRFQCSFSTKIITCALL